MVSMFGTLTGRDENGQFKHQILDDKVRHLLKQTKGHKNLEKHIHVEFWEMNKGYVTNIHVYSHAGLAEKVMNFMTKYWPNNSTEISEKLKFDYLNVDFTNQYEMVALTDIGVPAKFYNEVPQMMYIKFRPYIYLTETDVTMKVGLESKFYHHSDYGMKFFNPFSKVVQSVQRQVTTHATLPVEIEANFNLTNNELKIVFPRDSIAMASVTGFKVDSDDAVTVTGDEIMDVKCPICDDIKYIVTEDLVNKTNYENVIQFKEAGLEYSYNIRSCHDRTINAEIEEWLRILNTVQNPM